MVGLDFWSSFWAGLLSGLLSGLIINLTLGIILAVITGIIASLLFFLSLLLIKPRVEISDQMAYEVLEDGTYQYRVKVVNKSHVMITNLRYALIYRKEVSENLNNKIEVTEHMPLMPSIPAHRKTKKGGKIDTDYAIRIGYIVDPKKMELKDDTQAFIFTFLAEHPVSNSTACFTKKYTKKDLVEGIFQTGDSMLIIKKDAR